MSITLIEKIQHLKTQRKAVILTHNYQIGEVQDIADFVGDSLGLSIQAATTKAETIVFCGVRFMAETAAILSPEKTILLPDKTAGCPMADMINADQLRELKAKHPGALVVCYVNSTAEVKALSDYCCTSGNAVELVSSIPAGREVIFVPDKYLGQHVINLSGRDMILWPGYCTTHARITAEDIEIARNKYPDAVVLAHPECNDPVKAAADELLSTAQMIAFAKKSSAKDFIIATESGILHSLKKQNPEKNFIPVTEKAICPNMKKITLEKVLWSLEDMQYKITVDENMRIKAKAALDRMLEVIPG
ncbi:MAG TPA: quinolinate synthase NadA [Phycisphaerales bacterium]|nr:quinolinate synthase NadA [Phycisphaerales bacterium]